ncbi:hypothetical protein HPB52_008796 [Rhipicephalus sanguineus]|uniref:CCHC-type domain-containing protein n=1 Tax=Rhipicephalus sanguineus TaxID=34632 RepID=A0A9D4SYA3_RHISA|nr:hypothetical protein HPB52_008796 [Rhipicephalus sanguineus]
MAAPNQVTGYDPESLRIVSMDTAQTEATMPTEEEYLQDMLRVWRGKKNSAVASRDAGALAARQHTASRSQHAQGKSAPSVASQHIKQLQWRPKNTPRIEKDDIIVVLKPRETLDIKATFGPGQAGAAVRSILGADASVGLAVWPIWDQNVLVCTLKSVDAAEKLLRDITLPVGGRQLPFRGHPKLSGEFCRGVVHVSQDETSETVKSKLSAEPNVTVRKLGDTTVAVITFAGTKVPRTVLYNCERLPVHLYKKTVPACPLCGTVGHRADTCPRPQPGRCISCGVQVPAATPDGPTEHQCVPSCLLCGGGHKTGAPGCAGRFRKPIKSGSPRGSKPKTAGGHKQPPMPKTSPKKAPAAKSNKPEPKKAHTGPSTNAKPGTPSKPPVLMVKDFPPLTPVQAQQQIEELRRQNRFLARKIQELEAKQVGSSEPEQGAEVEDGDDGSSVTSDLTSVSRRDADTVVGSVSATGATGRLESLERKTEQLEERMAALPDQIMSAVRASFQDMFTAALTQALPEIMAQVSDSVLKAVQPWVSTQIKNTTQCDSPQLKRKTASRQAVDEDFSGLAPGGPVRPPIAAAPAPGPGRSPAP